jgi:hypothetical protein
MEFRKFFIEKQSPLAQILLNTCIYEYEKEELWLGKHLTTNR